MGSGLHSIFGSVVGAPRHFRCAAHLAEHGGLGTVKNCGSYAALWGGGVALNSRSKRDLKIGGS